MNALHRKLLKRTAVAFIGVAAVVLVPGLLHLYGFLPYFVAINRTPSIPVGLYLTSSLPVDKVSALEYDKITCFRYRVPDWAESRTYFHAGGHLCKYLVAKEGDTLAQDESGVWQARGADGVTRLVGRIAETDSVGRPLPQHMLSAGTVPSGHVLITAPALERSLDSRYLGFIPVNDLTMKKRPLLTYEGSK